MGSNLNSLIIGKRTGTKIMIAAKVFITVQKPKIKILCIPFKWWLYNIQRERQFESKEFPLFIYNWERKFPLK